MPQASRSARIRPARRLAFRIAGAVMLVQAAVFATAGFGYQVWYENNLEAEVEKRVLAPGRLIQNGQLPHSVISNRAKMLEVVGNGLSDALLVGANGNVFHALDPAHLGKQVSSIESIDPAWFRAASTRPLLLHHTVAGHPYTIGITPLITLDNIAPFLYAYVEFDASIVDTQRKQVRLATLAAVLFAILATTVVIYGVFEWILFRRIRTALRMLSSENGDSAAPHPAAGASDELELVEIGLQKIAADRQRERTLRTEAETALIEVQAKEAASAVAAQQAELEVRRARSLIEAVPDGIVTIDGDSRIATCNDTAARRLGRSQEDVIGRPLLSFLQPVAHPSPASDDDGAWPQLGTHRALCCGGAEEIEIVVSHADTPERHRVVFLRQAVDDEVKHELERLSATIGHALRLTPDQWQGVGKRLAMLRDYLSGLEAERRMVSDALDCVPVAVAVVDRNGTVRYANHLAERVLDMKDGLLIVQGRLSGARSGDKSQLRERILEVSAGSGRNGDLPWAAMRVERENGTAWFIRIAPLGRVGQQPPSGEGMVIVMISDPNMPMKPSTTMLRQMHGLTYAEADIMGRLTMGMRLADIATELDISIETVRTHLKSIFTKTGTSRQADLVRHAVLSGAMLQGIHLDEAAAAARPLGNPSSRKGTAS